MGNRVADLVVASFVITSGFLALIAIVPGNAAGTMLYVGGTGPGNYSSVSTAVFGANIGDTIYVYPGVYRELVYVDKPVTLIGESNETTIIDATNLSCAICVVGSHVNITGFKLTNASDFAVSAGLQLDSAQDCRITNNNVTANRGSGIRIDDYRSFWKRVPISFIKTACAHHLEDRHPIGTLDLIIGAIVPDDFIISGIGRLRSPVDLLDLPIPRRAELRSI